MWQLLHKSFILRPQKNTLLILILLVVLSFIGDSQLINAQQTIVGPVIFGQPVGGDIITFQDIGLNRTWHVNLANSSTFPSGWSNDGCKLLLSGGGTWSIVAVSNETVLKIPQLILPDIDEQLSGTMIWSYDGKSLTWTVYFSDQDVRIYTVNLDTFMVTPLLSLQESGSAMRWVSNTELLYQTRSGHYIWDTKANESRLEQNRLEIPVDWWSELYLTSVSPNQAYATRYYSQNALHSFIRASEETPPSLNASPEYVATLEAMLKIPGFDIYSAHDSKTKHVDVLGQFLEFLRWSPDNNQIAVTTNPRMTADDVNGIYIYHLTNESLQRVENFPTFYNSEYGSYAPSWSPDSNWLALNTPSGYIIYNLISQESIALSDEFDGFYMNLDWSPIMDYTNSSC
jgi:hypothetical protein